jgi:tetratricopeptide (TPR) repeat protein
MMDFKAGRMLWILLLFPLSCSSVGGVKKNQGEALMYGMVYNDENSPVAGAAVSVDGNRIALTDTQGRFILRSKQRKEFDLALDKEGYEEAAGRFRFEPMEVVHLTMVNAEQLVYRAEIAMDEGRYRDAAAYCDRALALDAARIDARYLKALSLIRLGDHGQARYLLESLKGSIGEREYIRKTLEGLP